jgi:hypothetical protein
MDRMRILDVQMLLCICRRYTVSVSCGSVLRMLRSLMNKCGTHDTIGTRNLFEKPLWQIFAKREGGESCFINGVLRFL